MNRSIIVFNAGSSSVKFTLFDVKTGERIFKGLVDNILSAPALSVFDDNKNRVCHTTAIDCGHTAALAAVLAWHEEHDDTTPLLAAGHRVVHGGVLYREPTVINDDVMANLETLIPLAPLHQPHNLEIAKRFASLHPNIPQIACFDTAFHRSQAPITAMFALPKKYRDDGILRYGFHGLSYAYIASVLPTYMVNKAEGRVIVAHLGNGASMCAMEGRKSVSSTMGFTALDGLVMGTRCGDLDPGVVLYLLEEKGMSPQDVTNLLYKESGLKGVSNISHDMRRLLECDDPVAKTAVELFCYRAAKQLASLIPDLGGLDALVFTAGIGEGSAIIRQKICEKLRWLGLRLDDDANRTDGSHSIHSPQSAVAVYVIPTNEERMIAQMTKAKVAGAQSENGHAR